MVPGEVDDIRSKTLPSNHSRKKSKISTLIHHLLHPEIEVPSLNDAIKKLEHSKSKSVSHTIVSTNKDLNKNNNKNKKEETEISLAQKLLEFLHLKDPVGEDLDVVISEEDLKMLTETVNIIHDRNDLSFKHKYHFIGSKIIGRGASGVVRLAAGNEESKSVVRFAVKELRRKKKQENGGEYLKKLIREFRIALLLHHDNVINTLDFVMIGSKWFEVMEYCTGGDLFAAIQRGNMSQEEIDCCFKQVVEGVKYLHEMGVSHRDLKPENLLIDSMGRIKITDFGVSEIFCELLKEESEGGLPALKEGEREIHKLRGLCGSCPYIAPEEFTGQEYDGRLVDVWSLGIIYYAMIFHGVPWEMAIEKNPHFKQFLAGGFDDFEPFSRIPSKARELLKRILEPDPANRATIHEICENEWFARIRTCNHSTSNSGKERKSFSYNHDSDHDDHPNPIHNHTA